MSTDSMIRVASPEGHPHVQVITLDAPPLNALGLEDYDALVVAFDNAARTRGVRCIVLTATGERCFCAGARIGADGQGPSAQRSLRMARVIQSAFERIGGCPLPVVGAINGAAVGAGLILASLCDILVAREKAVFALPEIDVGVMGGPRYTSRIIPDKIMRYMAFTGQKLEAEALCQAGAINFVTPAGELMPKALSIADNIAAKSPKAVRFMKEAINLGENMPAATAFRVEQLFNAIAAEAPDLREIAAARKEKRKPVFDD